jgi:hypothetical protein
VWVSGNERQYAVWGPVLESGVFGQRATLRRPVASRGV